MKPSVYLETSVISYLVSRASRDLLVAANQRMTHDWWELRRMDFEIFSSQLVVREASAGDPEAARQRLDLIRETEFRELNENALRLAEVFVRRGCMPKTAVEDALHVAIAAVYGIGYLLTWNCRHIANAEIVRLLSATAHNNGFEVPVLCTPIELMGVDHVD